MQQAGPPSSLFDSGSSPTSSKRSSIRFHADNLNPSRSLYLSPDIEQRVSPRTRTSPNRQHSPLNPHKAGISTTTRRRVRSVDTTDALLAFPSSHKKPASASFITPPRGFDTTIAFDSTREDNLKLGLFSDEYDLSHEDPRILQDVQRVLKLKARREARLGNRSISTKAELTSRLKSTTLSPIESTAPIVSPSNNTCKESISSDIDFSPSTGGSLTHPVPASIDNGVTLDWSGFNDRQESRWKISSHKRKEKEVLLPSPTVVNQLENTHADKIARLKIIITPHTLRKAQITREQLARRYSLVYNLLSAGTPLHLTEVSRWYGRQEELVRRSLEKAEPFTWLKHLDRNSTKPLNRSPRHLSALIMEEYNYAQNRYKQMVALRSSYNAPLDELEPSPLAAAQIAPTVLVTSNNNSMTPLKRSSSDGGITFEPLVESTRTSLEVGSRRSGESSFSSLPIGLPVTPASSSTRNRYRDFSQQIVETSENNNENSSRELSDHFNPYFSKLPNPQPGAKTMQLDNGGDPKGITLKLTVPTPTTVSEMDPPQSPITQLSAHQYQPSMNLVGRRRIRTSLPSAHQIPIANEIRLRQEASEEKAHKLKLQLLEETTAHNHRIRQLLNRISICVRDYETTQSNAMASLGIKHTGLPRELVDAFGHDPAAVTGATRRFRGWRAVDDIQRRLIRQRDVFRAFLTHEDSKTPIPNSVLDDPITSLVHSLNTLEVHHQNIIKRTKGVNSTLIAVQATHTVVKEEYNSTLSHTSAVYPELSYIVALEESYKDQYQQFWEFGMDTLTFLLDTVTPFWRNYGKPIGEDIRDFLVIPLYRNEFTGESKRYSIQKIPSRSFRHWLGLILFFMISITVNILQTRAAISSAVNYKLHMIPYESIRWTALPFFWVSIVIQWWAVVVEFAIVLMQIGVLAWWIGWSVRVFT